MNPDITISPYKPEDQAEVKALILAGLGEHWGTIDPSLNPDLNDIARSYAQATFLVAWLDGRVVGSGALVPRSQDRGEIVRMSVATGLRKHGLGRRILTELVEAARVAGYRQIYLETTDTWSEVIAFYQRCGFHITHYQGGDVYFAMDLLV